MVAWLKRLIKESRPTGNSKFLCLVRVMTVTDLSMFVI